VEALAAMKCPKCGKENPPGTAICKHCDFIVDPSFLDVTGEDGPPEDVLLTAKKPAPAPVDFQDFTRDAVSDERERLRAGRKVITERPKATTLEPEPDESYSKAAGEAFAEAGKVATSLWQKFKGLEFADRLTVGGALAAVLFTFLPWMQVVQASAETLLGLEMDGMILVFLAAVTLAAVILRRKPSWNDKVNYLIYGQAGASALAVLFVLMQIFRMRAYAPEKIYRVSVEIQGGIVLALIASGVMAFGSWYKLKPLLRKK
jgi:hypothetical protein